MMKCEVIQDLLSSYVDNTCSEETRRIVEEHLKECNECHSLYKELLVDHEIEYKTIEEKKVFKKVKKNYFKKILLVCLSFILLFTVFGSELSCYIVKAKMDFHVSKMNHYKKHDYEMIDFDYQDWGILGFGQGGSYTATYKGKGQDERFVVTTDGFWMGISDSYEYHIVQKHRTAERLTEDYKADIFLTLYQEVPEIVTYYGHEPNINLMVGLIPNMIPDKVFDYKIDVYDYLDLNMKYNRYLDEKLPFHITFLLDVNQEQFESEEVVRRIYNTLKEKDYSPSKIEIKLNYQEQQKVIIIEDMKY